jgi:cytochrome c oxidase assembly factor CtaG
MQFWCSAQGVPWTWEWRPYLGVWLLVALAALAYRRIYRTTPSANSEGPKMRRWRVAAAGAAIGCLWLLLDWPIGTLGAGYLESVHTVQFLGLGLTAPPLLLFGLPSGWEVARDPRASTWLARVTSPLTAFVGFFAIVFLTHLPPVVDALMVSQIGSFALDLAWLLGGLAFWWPVVRGWPPPGLGPGARLAYVLAGTASRMGIGMFTAIVPFPLYRLYELAPPIAGVDAFEDQQRAGGLMMFGDVLVGLVAVAILIYLWQRDEHNRQARAAETPAALT